jgi:ADP-dependent NAD(P)H-hydrate dehydratase / NAD(P)H-hydrate epimerase
MSLLLTAAQMRAVDGAIIETLGLPGLVLMENAGRGVADLIARALDGVRDCEARVVCGAGQNGGDGFVIARHLLARGARVAVLLALPAEKLTGDADVFAKVLRGLARDTVVDLSTETDPAIWRDHLRGADVVVDAIFGTGLRAAVVGVPAVAIAAMNSTDALRVAVDIPSGLDADTGEIRGSAVVAHLTATMGARKLGLLLDPEAPVGRVEVVDLGVRPESVVAAALAQGSLCHWVEADEVARLLPVRGPAAHKGTAGHLLVIAGSVGKTGAALLAARAGLRAGAGLVTVATTAAGQTALDAKVLAEMTATYAVGEAADGDSFDRLSVLAGRMKAAVLGPGIPTGQDMAELVRRLVTELPIPMVVDADALNLLGDAEGCAAAQAPRVLTPHPGEAARLRGSSVSEVQRDRLGSARGLAAAANAVVVLKGARTIVALPDGTAYVNPTANPALGTAGSGDVLSGAIGAFLAQGLRAEDAAIAAVFVHGMAAEVAELDLGASHLMASDLPDAIARACDELGDTLADG